MKDVKYLMEGQAATDITLHIESGIANVSSGSWRSGTVCTGIGCDLICTHPIAPCCPARFIEHESIHISSSDVRREHCIRVSSNAATVRYLNLNDNITEIARVDHSLHYLQGENDETTTQGVGWMCIDLVSNLHTNPIIIECQL